MNVDRPARGFAYHGRMGKISSLTGMRPLSLVEVPLLNFLPLPGKVHFIAMMSGFVGIFMFLI
jgi:hypothetical protein